MKTRTLGACTAAALLILLAGCSGDADPQPADAAPGTTSEEPGDSPAVTLTLGHPGPETEDAMNAFAELVAEKSGGTLAIEAFPAATLGTADEMLEGLQLGTTDIVIESIVGIESYTNLATIESVPFLYESDDAFLDVWNGAVGDEIRDVIAEDSGYRLLGAMYRGARYLTTKSPVENLDDLRGMTIRTPSAPTMIATWEALGARAEAMPYTEIYSAIESGVIDGQENPLGTILFNSFHEVAPNVAETEHIRMNYHFVMWDETLEGLSGQQREALDAAIDEISRQFSETTLEDSAAFRAELEEKGATFRALTDRDAWITATQPVIETLPDQVQQWVAQIRD